MDLNGKVAVVTGGASGIGKGIASRLLAQGMRVIIAQSFSDVTERHRQIEAALAAR